MYASDLQADLLSLGGSSFRCCDIDEFLTAVHVLPLILATKSQLLLFIMARIQLLFRISCNGFLSNIRKRCSRVIPYSSSIMASSTGRYLGSTITTNGGTIIDIQQSTNKAKNVKPVLRDMDGHQVN